MRVAAVFVVLSACFDDGGGSSAPPPPPADCGCIGDEATPEGECCASIICFFDESTNQWQIEICELPLPDQCESCTVDEICVQQFDGVCGVSTTCEPRTVECPDNVCSAECEQAYCSPAPFQCQNRSPCGGESPLAFTCYGP